MNTPKRPSAADLLRHPDRQALEAVHASDDASEPPATTPPPAPPAATPAEALRKISVSLPVQLHRALKLRAATEDVPVSNLIEALVRLYLDGEVTPDVDPIRQQRRAAMGKLPPEQGSAR